MSHGLSYGVRKASATILGFGSGLLLILVIAGAGVGSLLLASEVAFSVVRWRGLLPDLRGFQPVAGGRQITFTAMKRHRLARGKTLPDRFLTNATNPKGIIFMVAVLPQFMTDTRPLWTHCWSWPRPPWRWTWW